MPIAEGDYVLLRYSVYAVEDGEERLVDTTDEDLAKKEGIYEEGRAYGERLVILGKSQLIEAAEEALRSMEEGEEKVIEAEPEKAYGQWRSDLVIRVPLRQLRRHNIPAVVGQEVQIGNRIGRIIRVTERFAYIDFNHPLAGKKLKIHLKVVKVLKETDEKLRYLTRRWLGIEPHQLELEEGKARIVLPTDALVVSDLESRLQLLIRDIVETLPEVKSLDLTIRIDIPREEAKEQAEGEAEEKQAGEAEEAGKAEEAEKGGEEPGSDQA